MIGMDQRELGRKERAKAEYYHTLARYWTECGPVTTYSLSMNQLKQVMMGEKTVDEVIKEIEEGEENAG